MKSKNLTETVQRVDDLVMTLRSDKKAKAKDAKAFMSDFIKGVIEANRIAKAKNNIK